MKRAKKEWRWRPFPPSRRSLPPSPSVPPSSLLHDLTISLLGIKFDLDDPPFAFIQVLMSPVPTWQNFSCPTERSRCDIRDGSNNRRTFGPDHRLDRQARVVSAVRQLARVPTLRSCRICKCLVHPSFISSPCRRSMYVNVPSNVYIPLVSYCLWPVFVFFYHTSAKFVHVFPTSYRTIPPSSPHRLRHRVAYIRSPSTSPP